VERFSEKLLAWLLFRVGSGIMRKIRLGVLIRVSAFAEIESQITIYGEKGSYAKG